MEIAVCVKQIPGADVPERLLPDTKTLDRSGGLVLDESDTYSVEAALQLRDAAGSGEVVVLSMAPDGEFDGLRTALAMGADRAILISDPRLAGSDALSTAKALSAGIRRGGADLIVCATESSDGYTGTMPVQLAELLGYPSISSAKNVTLDGDFIEVTRQTETGQEKVRCSLPAVVTVTAGAVEPRYPTFRGIVAAKSKEIEVLSLAALDLPADQVGSKGARQEVLSVERAPTRATGALIRDEGTAEHRIIGLLEEWRAI